MNPRVLALNTLIAASMAAIPPAAAAPAPAPGLVGDPEIGSKLFLQCRACHTIGAGAHGLGPNLSGVVGAKAGKRPGFTYSAAMSGSGLTWDAATLDRFLTKPSAAVPGTRMAFAGVAAPKNRADLIAYLATLKPAKP